ncbi:MAG: tetratricopeptide repeat protein [Gemmatimonadaceae bacterium]
MLRPLYLAGTAYVLLCAVAIARFRGVHEVRVVPVGRAAPAPAREYPGEGGAWFARIKPYCNAVEVEVRQQYDPPPPSTDGAAYGAACFALAGKVDRARETIQQLPLGDARSYAAGVVFDVGHPVADAGDDASAGPIMRLVVEYQPDNYMALYHAGMSEYALGQHDVARDHLRRFLAIYREDDGWRANAREVLGRMGAGE